MHVLCCTTDFIDHRAAGNRVDAWNRSEVSVGEIFYTVEGHLLVAVSQLPLLPGLLEGAGIVLFAQAERKSSCEEKPGPLIRGNKNAANKAGRATVSAARARATQAAS